MGTLVVSDLHLGTRLGRDVLRRPEPLDALLDAAGRAGRLVLLGDVIELLEAEPRHAIDAARPVLRAIGARLGADGEVILIPGNHDRLLVRAWLGSRASLRVDEEVPPDATPMLASVVSCLSPARVRVNYPGAWLADGVWATHGHYLDRHLLPESPFGVARGLLRRPTRDAASPADYEQPAGRWHTRVEGFAGRWLPRPLAALVEDLAELARAATMPSVPFRMLNPGMAPWTAKLLGTQMRRASVPALVRVAQRLGIDARWLLFGHVHRCGPLPGESTARWSGSGGSVRVANTGSWVYEPLLVHGAVPPHPYWPGGAVVLEEGSEPRAVGLLNHLDAKDLRPPRGPLHVGGR